MFGLSFGIIGAIAFILLVGFVTFKEESSIGAGIGFLGLGSYLFFLQHVSITQLIIYSIIYIVLGIAWATFRLIRDTKNDFEVEQKDRDRRIKSNLEKDEDENHNEGSYFSRKDEIDSDKELLEKILERLSFSLFGYRVFFLPVDVIEYIFSDLLKEIFKVIKIRVKGYLFRSILGQDAI